jgi:hypothetical protein
MVDLRGSTLLTGGSVAIGAIENIDDSMAGKLTWPRKTNCPTNVIATDKQKYYGFQNHQASKAYTSASSGFQAVWTINGGPQHEGTKQDAAPQCKKTRDMKAKMKVASMQAGGAEGGNGGATPGCKFDATTLAECPETDKCLWNVGAQRCQGKQAPGGGCNPKAKAEQDCPETSSCKWNDATKLCEAKSGGRR